MTIKGFIDFIKSEKDLKQTIELNKTIVIIDGHLIQRRLNDASDRSQQDGRYCDYTTYAETIKSFLRRLKICEIVPIIVFDGSINPSRYRRSVEDRIHEIHTIIKNGYNSKNQSPTLRNYVFQSVVRQFGIQVIQTFSKTWAQVAALANKLMCPVFSQRKDFYFQNLEFGLLDDISLMTSRLHFNKEHKYWFLTTKVLRFDSLQKKFSGLRPEVMPLLAVVLENDAIDQNGYKRLSEEIGEWHKSDKIQIILNWIKGKNLETCLESISQYIKPNAFDEDKSDHTIRELLKEYKSSGSDSVIREYLNGSDFEKEYLKMLAKGDNEVVLPNWFVNEYQKGIIRPALMNIVKCKTHVVFPQIEDFSQNSSYDSTLKLRRVLYGLLRTERNDTVGVKVYDRTALNRRQELSLKEDFIAPLQYISDTQELPFLANIRLLDISERRKILLSVLETSESFINRCKVSLVLLDFFEEMSAIDSTTFLIVITRYLILQKRQNDWTPAISALVLSIMFFGRKKLRDDLKWNNLRKIPIEEEFIPKCIQFFAQIQSCLHITNFINTILEIPLEEGKPYFCLNGIFLYNAIRNLSSDEEYESFLKYLFRNWSSMAEVFYDIKHLFEFDLNV